MISLKEFIANQEFMVEPENIVAKLSPIHLHDDATPYQKRMYNIAYDRFLDKNTDIEHKKDLEKILEKALLRDFSKLENWHRLEEMNNLRKEKIARL